MTAPANAPQPISNRDRVPFGDSEEYRQALLKCYLVMQCVAVLDLERLAEAQDSAASVGPLLDPTLWREKADAMAEDRAVVRALQAAVRVLPADVVERLRRQEVLS